MEIIESESMTPSVGASLENGWNVMKKYFLILLLAVIVVGLIMGPSNMFTWKWDMSDGFKDVFPHSMYGMFTLGVTAFFFMILGLAYAILITPIFRYGGKMMFLQAVRDIRPDFNLLVKGFKENYLNIVLASLLNGALIAIGMIALVIPGIIIACRLAFTGYLVMDKNLDPISAVEGSWKMTKGHGWKVFSLAIISFFIFIAGLCVLFVGVLPATIWVNASFASLYESINKTA